MQINFDNAQKRKNEPGEKEEEEKEEGGKNEEEAIKTLRLPFTPLDLNDKKKMKKNLAGKLKLSQHCRYVGSTRYNSLENMKREKKRNEEKKTL
uniref:Uncharacterized protein n=1 Tax=Bracon brevicornis TaxID=1563983 RepID=A0A6V7J3L1_9HYME